ncbi:hypothetical protein HYS48_01015 [Candidatus Woesearchaeota archaeon]|nr:hypothetical protein [Candidatus Woesearchaeota archaeon]
MKYQFYLEKAFDCLTEQGEMPEFYFANTRKHNGNVPFGMGQKRGQII